MPTEANSSNFETEVLNHAGSVLVDFYTTSCAPCRMMTPVLEEIAQERNGRLKIVKVDAAENNELAAQFRVAGVPAFLLFNNGQVQKQIVGARSKKAFEAWLDAKD